MDLGIVSNCWRLQLERGIDLAALVGDATAQGYNAIELRQGALGRFESRPDNVPDADALAELPRQFPEVRFNLALAMPFLDLKTAASRPIFTTGVSAAVALAGYFPPHLRLVDTTTADAPPEDCDPLAARLATMARVIGQRGGILSLENARQSWRAFHSIWLAARRLLGDEAVALRICYDAANLIHAADHPDPRAVVRSLAADDLALVHLKQSSGGQSLPALSDGDTDWRDQLAVLGEAGYRGPYQFEIPPNERIGDRLKESRDYLCQVVPEPRFR